MSETPPSYKDITLDVEYTEDKPFVIIPTGKEKDTIEVINTLVKKNKLTPQEESWLKLATQGIDNLTFNDSLQLANRELTNTISSEGVSLNGYTPPFRQTSGVELSGKKAVMAFLNHLGTGHYFHIPLWHSGIWVTLEPPTENDIIELYRSISEDKISIGRATHGIIYSNLSVITIERVMNFVMDHIHAYTVEVGKDRLLDYIKIQDYMTLVWGVLNTMYPSGFQLKKPCIHCQAVIEEVIDLKKTLWVDKKRIRDTEYKVMTNKKPKSVPLETIKSYQTTLHQPREVDLGHDIKVTFTVPSITEYIQHGTHWLDNLLEMVEDIDETDEDFDKDTIITTHAQASTLRQYEHWVDSISFGGDIVNDKETINDLLTRMSSIDDLVKRFLEEVIQYIKDSTVAVVGIPSYDCPQCEEGNTEKEHQNTSFKEVLSLDLVNIFFSMGEQIMTKILQR